MLLYRDYSKKGVVSTQPLETSGGVQQANFATHFKYAKSTDLKVRR